MNQKLGWAVSGFVFGIWLRSFVNFGWSVPVFFLLLALIFWILWFGFERESFYLACAIFLLSGALGIARYDMHDKTGEMLLPTGEQNIQALVIDEPDERENFIRYVAEIGGETKISIIARPNFNFQYGDLLEIRGILESVDEEYLNKDEIYYEIAFPEIKLIKRGQGNPIKEKLFAIKVAFLDRLGRVISEPASSLAGGLVVGAKQSLGEDLLTRFRNVGLIHVIVLSGYNLTLVADFIKSTLGVVLPVVAVTWLSVLAIIAFAIMAGAGATVVRATIMALLVLLARSTGRMYDVTRALVVAGLCMLIHNPKVLVFDIGFQLSFLATLGLLYLEPLVAERLKFLPEKVWIFKFREIAAATVAAQLAVLPWILYKFGNLSLLAIPANLLVLPIVPHTMFLVFLVGLAGFIFHPISWILAFPAYMLLAYQLFVTKVFSSLPFASLDIKSFPLPLVIIFYGVIVIFAYRSRVVSLPHS